MCVFCVRKLHADIDFLRSESRLLYTNLLKLSQRCVTLETDSKFLPIKLAPITALQESTANEWLELLTGMQAVQPLVLLPARLLHYFTLCILG